ncbi:DUF1214 domain-containing protein [Ruegeria atlantica]|uniref:DUF1214 domain-containing protein n=1 Tax=Ruegeria atlantica TaxID=81569 RepID=A0AA90ZGC8_9RHOB|nr:MULTISPECIES: DUF1214 domain-containing protein [Ruegeria]NOC85925.1 DUF1214 domain-containing protein [Ruegeria sp. HKCCD6428]NOD32822.1 DUF1214 domain-containing protein [Ruegeria atlantica]NOE19094.1 DUF1214 domain-containing protein [Ruegeria atlantica]
MNLTHKRWKLAALAVLIGSTATAQSFDTTVDALAETYEVPITINNFVRAATDNELKTYNGLAGGVNQFFHFKEPTPIDNQPTIRMNRDTLYSVAVIDISQGATLTLPDVGDRYMTTMVVNQDHFINEVFDGGGVFQLDMGTFHTPYVLVFMRILVDAENPKDVAAVNAIQDGFTIDAASATPFEMPNYDAESFEALRQAAIELGRFATDSVRTFGKADHVDPLRHFLGTAVGFGGLPEDEAFYLNIEPGLPLGEYKIQVPADVPVNAFWSVSLYNADGFFELNSLDTYVVNSVSGTKNDDGSVTVHFGGCNDGRVNCLPIMDGWNYAVRLYQPGPEVIDGSWVFPSVEPAN